MISKRWCHFSRLFFISIVLAGLVHGRRVSGDKFISRSVKFNTRNICQHVQFQRRLRPIHLSLGSPGYWPRVQFCPFWRRRLLHDSKMGCLLTVHIAYVMSCHVTLECTWTRPQKLAISHACSHTCATSVYLLRYLLRYLLSY